MSVKYKKVPYRTNDSVKVIKYSGEYKGYNVSIMWGSDHNGWLFYVDNGSHSFNSMRKGQLYKTKEEAIECAEKYIDSQSRRLISNMGKRGK